MTGLGSAAFIALVISTPAFACSEDEGFLFTCMAEDQVHAIELCGTQEDTGEGLTWTGLRYLYQTEKGEELSYPANPAEGPQKLFFSHLFRNGLYEAQVRFAVDGAAYRLFSRDEADAGLEIMEDGKTATIACGESPIAYFDELRKLLACDMENPFGAQGCSNQVPNVK